VIVRHIILPFALAAATLATAPLSPPAFPGAEGFGARTPGGRGGRIIVVRNLNDSGPGSFRDAATARGPRVIVFGVSGLITLASPVEIREPYVTIAGQSAPGDGICFRGSQVSILTHDVIVRFLRFRPGDISSEDVDSLDVMGDSHDVIIDHCSATWSIDENLSASGRIKDVTIQWSLIAEGLNQSHHSKGAHGYGSLVRAVGGVTLHHNLWAHNSERNPRLGDNYGTPPCPVFDVRNNVIYDYGKFASGLTGDQLSANYVGNYVRPGPSSDRARGVIVLTDTAAATYFVEGNLVEGRSAWTADNALLFDRTEIEGRRLVTVVKTPFAAPPVRTTSATDALREVLDGAGATLPRRDAVDRRIVREVEQSTGAIIDSQVQVGGWPEYRSAPARPDTDKDGIPDEWERTHRLDRKDPSDASRAGGRDGYTNIEAYLNELAKSAPAARRPDTAKQVVWYLDNLASIAGHPVTVVGAPRVVEAAVGRAVEFNGRTDGLFLDVNPLAGLDRFTIEAVFAPDADGPEEQRFLHVQETGSENRVMMETRILPDRSWCLDTFLRHDPSSLTLIDRRAAHPSDSWHVAALRYDGRTMTHYVDGIREAEGPLQFGPIGAGRTSIGVRQNLAYWFKGRLRLIRITPEALPADRLLAVPQHVRGKER
jgi:pectate lyase